MVDDQLDGYQEIDDDDDEPKPARRALEPEKKKRKWLKVSAIVLGIVVTIVAAVAGFYVFSLNGALGEVKRNPSLLPSDRLPEITPSDPAAGRPVTFVLMGTDAAEGGTARSDSLMVAYLPANRKQLYLVSFTRDMWVKVPGHGESKINAAYALGGSALTVQTLESLLKVRMDHVVSINFAGFVQLTTVLGGVEVYNEHASATGGFTFPAGPITISGERALIYVRERKTLPNGDLDRAKRQRDVLTAIVKKATSAGVIANPFKLKELISEVAKVVEVDPGLTNGAVYGFASELQFSEGSIRSLQAPILGFGTSPDGQSINKVNYPGIAELSEAMRTDTMDAYYEKHKG